MARVQTYGQIARAYARRVVKHLKDKYEVTDLSMVTASWLRGHGYGDHGLAGIVHEGLIGDYSLADLDARDLLPAAPAGMHTEPWAGYLLIIYED